MRWFTVSLALLVLTIVNTSAYPRVRRDAELQESENLSPLSENPSDNEEDREKRALEAASQAKWGVKNAILGFVFGKINQLIDTKTHLINQLDQQNIAKNKAYGIEAPASGVAGIGSAFTAIIGPKLQLIGPKLNLLTGALGSFSGGSKSSSDSSSGGSGLGSILRIFTSLSGSSGGGASSSGSVTLSDSNDTDDDDDDDDDKDDDTK